MSKFSLDLTGIKGAIASILIVLSLIVSVLGAVQNALPPAVETLGTSNFDSITLSGDLSAANVDATTAIKINSVSFSGVAKWGAAATYTSGSSITHGFATTPTVCLMLPARDVTSTLTITATGFSSNRATQATPVYWFCGQ